MYPGLALPNSLKSELARPCVAFDQSGESALHCVYCLYNLLYMFADCIEAGSYRYLGCFKDVEGMGRDLNGRYMILTDLTLDVCAGQCQPVGFPYFGVQLIHRCFCGENFGAYGASIGNCFPLKLIELWLY